MLFSPLKPHRLGAPLTSAALDHAKMLLMVGESCLDEVLKLVTILLQINDAFQPGFWAELRACTGNAQATFALNARTYTKYCPELLYWHLIHKSCKAPVCPFFAATH